MKDCDVDIDFRHLVWERFTNVGIEIAYLQYLDCRILLEWHKVKKTIPIEMQTHSVSSVYTVFFLPGGGNYGKHEGRSFL